MTINGKFNIGNDNEIKKIDYLVLLCILFSQYGFYFSENFGIITVPVCIILILFNNEFKFKKNIVIIFISTLFLVLISSVFNGFILKPLLFTIASLTISFLYVSKYKFEKFKIIYVSILKGLSIFSLISYFMFLIMPNIIQKLPVLVNSAGTKGYFLLFSVIVDTRLGGALRNFGIFWEPGAYQTFLVLAFLFQLYSTEKKDINLVIFLITMFTTYSTTGFICMLILSTLWGVERAKFNKKFTYILLLFCMVGFVVYFSTYFNEFLYYSTFSKIENFFNYKYGVDNFESVRAESIIFPMKLFLTNPLLGVGEHGYSELKSFLGHGMLTCTPINWFAYYGISIGIIYMIGYYKFTKYLIKDSFIRCVIFFLLLISISSEAYGLGGIIGIIIYYAYSTKFIKGEKNEIITYK